MHPTQPIQGNALSHSVGSLMRPIASVHEEDSLHAAAIKIREQGVGVLPVIRDGRLVGVVTQAGLASAMAEGATENDPVTRAIDPNAGTIPLYASGAEALRLFNQNGATTLVVVDDRQTVLGGLTAADLYGTRLRRLRPPMIGGMATPFGVYLSTGTVNAGPGWLAMVTTGMSLAVMIGVAVAGTAWALTLVHLKPLAADAAITILPLLFFAIGMRLIPLTGIHAAEHMVVHAIERGEDLVPEVVKRMPRVHPRCGTNYAAGASLYLWLATTPLLLPLQELQLLVALVLTLVFWRRVGGLFQYWITTKPPTDRQVAMGIKSGQELLDKYEKATTVYPTFFQSVLNSGMVHVASGVAICYGAAYLVARMLHLDLSGLQ